jgi:hypothetical protein
VKRKNKLPFLVGFSWHDLAFPEWKRGLSSWCSLLQEQFGKPCWWLGGDVPQILDAAGLRSYFLFIPSVFSTMGTFCVLVPEKLRAF